MRGRAMREGGRGLGGKRGEVFRAGGGLAVGGTGTGGASTSVQYSAVEWGIVREG